MSEPSTATKLRFACDLSEQDFVEARTRGYLSHVFVEIMGQRCYPVFFYDAVRLQQDLQESGKHGRPFVADPGMIVLPEITVEAMETVVERLYQEGYFEYFVP